jgi:hypothetical protein
MSPERQFENLVPTPVTTALPLVTVTVPSENQEAMSFSRQKIPALGGLFGD